MQLNEPVARPSAAPRARIAPTQEAKRARTLLVLIPGLSLLLVVGGRLLLTSDAFSQAAARVAAEAIASRTRGDVHIAAVRFGLDLSPCFEHLRFEAGRGALRVRMSAQQACVERWASAVGSGFHAVRVRLDHPSIELLGGQEVAAARSGRSASSATAAVSRRALREIQVVFDDLTLDWDQLPIPERFAQGTFGPIDGVVTVQNRGGDTAATLSIREQETGSSINARLDPTGGGFDISAGMEGDLVPILGRILVAGGLDVKKLPTRGTVGAVYDQRARRATIDVDLEQHDVDLANALVSANRLRGFTARESARVLVDLENNTLETRDGVVEVNGVPLVLNVKVTPGLKSPAFEVRADLRTTPLLRLLRSVPDAAEPAFAKDVSPAVQFALSFSISGELRDPATWQPRLEHRFVGFGPLGQGSGLEYLQKTFPYYPLTKEGRAEQPLLIGPDSPDWQPLARVPYVQRRGVLVSEDSSFYFHNGIEIGEMQEALKQSMTTGQKTRGGSTLSQQLVKNLFLTRDRTALRKLQEALLTFHLESVLSKDQIFELYLNLIEWGPGIYGLRPAALHYFGRRPEALKLREMLFLAVIIPGPTFYHRQWEQGWVTPKVNAKIDALAERLHRLGQIKDAQLEEIKSTKIHFARPKKMPPPQVDESLDEQEEQEP